MGPGAHSPLSDAGSPQLIDGGLGRDDNIDPATAARIERGVQRLEQTQRLRWAADLIALWGLCGRAACRRAGRCRGEPRDCLPRCAPLVPEDVREGAKLLAEARANGMSFDEVLQECSDAIEDIGEWMELVEQSARKVSRWK
jgi:hypothetical protein